MNNIDHSLRAELVARIAFREGTIATWATTSSLPPAAEPTSRSNTGFAWFEIAACRLMLDEPEAAAEAFAAAAEWTRLALAVTTPPSLALYSGALESAVLSGRRDLSAGLAADVIGPESRPSLLGDRLSWALALPSLLREADDEAARHIEAALAVPPDKAWYPGLGHSMAALTARNEPAFVEGLERVLAKHVHYARSKKSHIYNSGRALICVPAAVLLRLAAWRGISSAEIRGRRARIPLTLVHSAPGQSMEILADFLPETLTT